MTDTLSLMRLGYIVLYLLLLTLIPVIERKRRQRK